ncbi:pentapeptide repeat-containing protein [Streptomyces sp. NPDC056468]|uniref:pentapeptide repeat-containing protein n=1 Tax=Streptomyces sp. NPDC056468 TaxID=3345830 RepID=UPI0036BED1AC
MEPRDADASRPSPSPRAPAGVRVPGDGPAVRPRGREPPGYQQLWGWCSAARPEANLSGADLIAANLHGARLSAANRRLEDVPGTELETDAHASLRNADLTEADLTDADLRGVDLSGADLTRTDLRGAKLKSVILTGATTTGGRGLPRSLLSQAKSSRPF